MTRIMNIEVLYEGFSNKEFNELEIASKPVYKKIVLRFPKEVDYRVYDEFDITQVEIQTNGDLIAVSYTHLDVYKRQRVPPLSAGQLSGRTAHLAGCLLYTSNHRRAALPYLVPLSNGHMEARPKVIYDPRTYP